MGVITREVCGFLSRISRARVKREKVEPRVILKIEDSCINCKGEQTEEKVEHTKCNEYESHV